MLSCLSVSLFSNRQSPSKLKFSSRDPIGRNQISSQVHQKLSDSRTMRAGHADRVGQIVPTRHPLGL